MRLHWIFLEGRGMLAEGGRGVFREGYEGLGGGECSGRISLRGGFRAPPPR